MADRLSPSASWSLSGIISRAFQSMPKSQPKLGHVSRRLQFMSDLHLEIGQQYTTFDFPVTAPYLILGGDIGRLIDYDRYLAFLQRRVALYKRIFLVLGNHEFYGMSYVEGVQKARQLEAEPSLEAKVTVLQQGRHELDLDLDPSLGPASTHPPITIIGCVLWSQIAPEWAERIAGSVSDFSQIHDWKPDAHKAAHAADLSWLKAELNRISAEDEGKPEPRQIVVVTHHAPLTQGTASPRHKDSPFGSAFATDICTGAGWGPVKYWVFGHTHWTTDIAARNGVRVISNQRGYVFPGQKQAIDQGSSELPPRHTFNASAYLQL